MLNLLYLTSTAHAASVRWSAQGGFQAGATTPFYSSTLPGLDLTWKPRPCPQPRCILPNCASGQTETSKDESGCPMCPKCVGVELGPNVFASAFAGISSTALGFCPCGTSCTMSGGGMGTCQTDGITCAQNIVAPNCGTSGGGCQCGTSCRMSGGGLGTCQTDGVTCAQNIVAPNCAGTVTQGTEIKPITCADITCGRGFTCVNGRCFADSITQGSTGGFCQCGTSCKMSGGGIGVCQTDGFTCAINIMAPKCGGTTNCPCGTSCTMNGGGIGTCQTDGVTCAQNIIAPNCYGNPVFSASAVSGSLGVGPLVTSAAGKMGKAGKARGLATQTLTDPVNACALILCLPNHKCVNGACEPINPGPCATVRCAAGTRCMNGQCVSNTLMARPVSMNQPGR